MTHNWKNSYSTSVKEFFRLFICNCNLNKISNSVTEETKKVQIILFKAYPHSFSHVPNFPILSAAHFHFITCSRSFCLPVFELNKNQWQMAYESISFQTQYSSSVTYMRMRENQSKYLYFKASYLDRYSGWVLLNISGVSSANEIEMKVLSLLIIASIVSCAVARVAGKWNYLKLSSLILISTILVHLDYDIMIKDLDIKPSADFWGEIYPLRSRHKFSRALLLVFPWWTRSPSLQSKYFHFKINEVKLKRLQFSRPLEFLTNKLKWRQHSDSFSFFLLHFTLNEIFKYVYEAPKKALH